MLEEDFWHTQLANLPVVKYHDYKLLNISMNSEVTTEDFDIFLSL